MAQKFCKKQWDRSENAMSTARYVHWQDGEMWLSYFESSPISDPGNRSGSLKRTLVTFTGTSRAVKFQASAGWLN